MLKLEEIKKYSEIIAKSKIKCMCGHSIAIPPHLDKVLCRWCGNYVFKNKELEFKYRLKEMINNVKAKS